VWCSGAVVRHVDFFFPGSPTVPPLLLQIKNRDNSENSSSSKVREGKKIEHWFRSYSRRHGENWDAFPNNAGCSLLSESDFQAFVQVYMQNQRSRE